MMFWPGCCCACGTIAVTVRLCSDNSLISGATVTVKDNLGATVGSGTTSGTGIVAVDIPVAATYTIVVAKSGQATATRTISATCTANAVSVTLGRVITVTVNDCSGNAGSGVAVAATLSGVTWTATTDSSGVAAVAVTGTGTYSVTATHASARFAPTTNASVSVSTCSTSATILLAAASGYVCLSWTGFNCDLPVAKTLFCTDSVHGAVTLTYTPASGGAWEGSKSISFPACNGCIAVTQTVTWSLSELSTNPAASVGSRVYKASDRSDTVAPPSFCLGTDAEPNVSLSPVVFTLASRTCPPSFSFTSNTIVRNVNDCSGADSTLTITE